MLRQVGVANVMETGDVRQAAEVLGDLTNNVNFIICDWNLPEISGLSFLQKVRKEHHWLSFLMVTGRTDLESVVEAKKAGVSGYICKPFSPKELSSKIDSILRDQ